MDPKPDCETACLDAIRHAFLLPRLADYAEQRHGYSGGEGVFGVTYPGDLDDYDREVDGRFIPPGYIRIYGWWWPPREGYERFVSEMAYLNVLARVLGEEGLRTEADRVRALLPPNPLA